MHFQEKHVVNLFHRAIATEHLAALGNVWIGRDVAVAMTVIIRPRQILRGLPIVVSQADFPPIVMTRGALSALSLSVRSCLAQSGIEIRFHQDDLSDEIVCALQKVKNAIVPVTVENHGGRPIVLDGGVMRFFWVNDRQRLRHGTLRRTIGRELVIEGGEGKDWSYGDIDMEDDGVRVIEGIDPALLRDVCIKLPLRPTYYIPRSKHPIHVRSKKDLPVIHRRIRPGRSPEFSIGETVPVKLGPDVFAVINTLIYDRDKRHIHSPLIDSGFTGPIRTETVRGQEYIELFVYRK